MKNLTDLIVENVACLSRQREAIGECNNYIETEVRALRRELKRIPEGKVPSFKLRRRAKLLEKHINTLLSPFDKGSKDLKYISKVKAVELEIIRLSLIRFAEVIRASESVNPFGTFYELHHMVETIDLKTHSDLQTLFNKAVKALFVHPEFVSTLQDRIWKKMQMLAEKSSIGCFGLHRKVKLFLEHYNTFSKFNKDLVDNDIINKKITHLEAAVTLKEITVDIECGNTFDPDRSALYIKAWIDYLNQLELQQQLDSINLIEIVNRCSDVFNQRMAANG